MTFGISNSVKSQQVRECTAEMLREAIDSPHVAQVCAEIKDAWEQEKRGEITLEEFEELKGRLKKQLPILTPHATFRNGRRLNADAVPSGLSMYDLDHIPDPEGRWREIEPRKDELGIVMAHITPSAEGLRLIFIIPQGMNLAQAQRWMADMLGDKKYDECVKDYARCSFIVPREYVLYMSDKIWEDHKTPADPKTLPPAPPQGRGVVTTDLRPHQQDIIPPPLVGGMGRGPEGVVTTDNGVDSQTTSALMNGKLSTPSASLVPPVSGGQSVTTELCPHQTVHYTPSPCGRDGEGSSLVSVLEEQLGGIPTHGSRNNFIFTMACHLRYVCNDDPEWIARILPTYGENREKWMATIRSACNRNQTPHMSRLMQRVLAICKEREREEQEAEKNPDMPPQMPRVLPPLIRLLVSKTPDIYKPAVAHAVFPALAAHLWQTRFRYIDNVEHEATLMNVLMAGTGAGKNCISEPINRIMADIRLKDAESLRREQEWKREVQSKGANKDKRQRPEGLVIQEVDPDMTNAAFVQRLADAGERFLYTKMNEIDQFDALKGSGRGKAQFQIMCLAFDPQNAYGQTRIGTGSVTEKVSIRFNWNASTTIGKGRRYFSQVLTDGPISRINFCTIPEREIGAEMPIYGVYDASFDEELRPYIENLNKARGLIDCPKARTLAKRLVEECADFSRLSQSRVYENLSYRANVIAYLKAMVLFVASGGKWDKTVENFIRWSLQYDLWCKMRFFGREIELADSAINIYRRNGPQNMLDLLPDVFTVGELRGLSDNREMSNKRVSKLLYNWKTRGYIKLHGEEMPQDQKDMECYEKTEFYKKKFGSQKELV